ncbi:UvrD-helicase domain-containing protein [Anaerolineales bacterium HSG24]|nr:UvrD-helicase domain-containing protein [Anaerolineales bacterium HSG24]
MTNLLVGLNDPQREAVTTIDGPVLTLAGPGSGKTRALTHRIAYLIQECGIAPWNILAVTFTNKAAKEMRNRLLTMLSENQVYYVSVGTFHSLCARWLRREIEVLGYYDTNFVIYDTNEQQTIVKKALREMDLDEKRWRPNAMHRVISNAKNEMITPDKLPVRTYQEEIAARVYEQYQKLMQQNNAMDFDDLLLITHLLFQSQPEVLAKYREQYQYVMVDEFQDTNMVQYQLVQMLAGKHGNIFSVGDIDQGIYSWRGADYRNVLNFQKDYPTHKLIRLSQNYRSTDTIVNAAKHIISKNTQRIENELFTERGLGHKIKQVEKYDAEEEADYVVSEVRRLNDEENIPAGDVAVMYRTNAQSRLLEEAFIRQSMPYLLLRGIKFYERKEIKDLLAYLRVLHNPADSLSLSRIINVPARGIGAKTISKLDRWAFSQNLSPLKAILRLGVELNLQNHPFSTRSKRVLTGFGQLLDRLFVAKENLSLPDFFDFLVARSNYKEFTKDGSEEGEERWENLLELRRSMTSFGPTSAVEVLGEFLENVALVADADMLTEENSATALLTLHTAKGLEFPVVFIVGMEDGLFPHSRSAEDSERMEEERRLAYVGVTRAKDRLYLTRAFRRQRGYSGFYEPSEASRFLSDLPPELVDGGRRSPRKSSTISRPKNKSTRWGSTKKSATPTKTTVSYKIGEKVTHAKFGKGTVISTKIDRGEEYVQVAFEGQGIKTLAVSFAKLERS